MLEPVTSSGRLAVYSCSHADWKGSMPVRFTAASPRPWAACMPPTPRRMPASGQMSRHTGQAPIPLLALWVASSANVAAQPLECMHATDAMHVRAILGR